MEVAAGARARPAKIASVENGVPPTSPSVDIGATGTESEREGESCRGRKVGVRTKLSVVKIGGTNESVGVKVGMGVSVVKIGINAVVSCLRQYIAVELEFEDLGTTPVPVGYGE